MIRQSVRDPFHGMPEAAPADLGGQFSPGLRVGVDERSDGICFRERQLPGEIGSFRKFPALGRDRARVENGPQGRRGHADPAVTGDLRHILSGIGMRGAEERTEHTVDDLVPQDKVAVAGRARRAKRGLLSLNERIARFIVHEYPLPSRQR